MQKSFYKLKLVPIPKDFLYAQKYYFRLSYEIIMLYLKYKYKIIITYNFKSIEAVVDKFLTIFTNK